MTNWIDRYTSKLASSRKAARATKFLVAVHDIARMNGAIPKTLPTSYDDRLSLFCDTFHLSAESITASAKLLVTLVADDPDVFDKIIHRMPGVSVGMLEALYRCGRYGIDPMLMLRNSQVVSRVLQMTPGSISLVVANGVPVADKDGQAVAYRPLDEVTAQQVAMATDEDGDLLSGAKLLIKDEERRVNRSKPVRYEILEDGTVVFRANTRLDPSTVEAIAEQAKQTAREYLKRCDLAMKV